MAYRPEIDGLRAIAVLAVILYHFFPHALPGGFLGVDIFFVISGFLITQRLTAKADLGYGAFLLDFYARRIKRILPALFFCVIITMLLIIAVFFITTQPYADIPRTGAYALLGGSNFYLLHQSSNYFSLQTQLNPFTQTWSLGVEEQFYLVFPCILYAASHKKHSKSNLPLIVILVLSAISLLLFAWQIPSPMAAYYLMPMRFWELGAGALAALIARRSSAPSPFARYSLPIIALLLATFFAEKDWQIAAAVAAVALTALLLFSKPGPFAYALLSSKPMVQTGLLSYELYLWHWSVLVLGKWTVGVTPKTIPFLLLIILGFSLFSYVMIEKPLRYAKWASSMAKTLSYGIGSTAITAVIIITIAHDLSKMSHTNYAGWFGVPAAAAEDWQLLCHGHDKVNTFKDPIASCLQPERSATKPHTVFVAGDSHAMQLVFMLKSALENSRFDIRYMNSEDPADFPYGFLTEKPADSATLDHMLHFARRGDVVILAFHRGRLNDAHRDDHIPLEEDIQPNAKTVNFIRNTDAYLQQFEQAQVRIILIRDTPLMNVISASSACFLQIKISGSSVCRVSKSQDLHTRTRQDYAFDTLASAHPDIRIWDPLASIYLNRDSFDVVNDQGVYTMTDWDHISKYQSESLAPAFQTFLAANHFDMNLP